MKIMDFFIGIQIRDDWLPGGFLVLVSLLGLIHCIIIFINGIRSFRFRPTKAKICFHDKNSGRLKYEYYEGKRKHQNERIKFGVGGFQLTDSATLQVLNNNEPITVFVDPSNPTTSVIFRGVSTITFTIFVLYLTLLFSGIFWLAGYGTWGGETPGGLL